MRSGEVDRRDLVQRHRLGRVALLVHGAAARSIDAAWCRGSSTARVALLATRRAGAAGGQIDRGNATYRKQRPANDCSNAETPRWQARRS